MKKQKSRILCLCEARHPMPSCVEGAIFPTEVNPLDLNGMQQTVCAALEGVTHLDLYVTGLTVALGAVMHYCVENAVALTLWHYDRDMGDYYPQWITRNWHCPDCDTWQLGTVPYGDCRICAARFANGETQ